MNTVTKTKQIQPLNKSTGYNKNEHNQITNPHGYTNKSNTHNINKHGYK